jgi:integrase
LSGRTRRKERQAAKIENGEASDSSAEGWSEGISTREGMMVYQRGKRGFWWYRFRLGGRIVHESAKSCSKTVAREAERQRRRGLEEKYNKIEKRTLPPRFEQAALAWLGGEKPHLAERTHDIYHVAIRCHLTPALGSWLLCDIDGDAIKSYQARRKAEGAAARTLNKELQVLRQVLKRHKLWADLQGEVKFERESENIGKALTHHEETQLLKACESNHLLHTAVTVALNTTLRKNEIRLLRWGQIDFLKRTLTVGKSKTEGGSGREIPLNAPAHAALTKWAVHFPESKAEDYVFPACEAAGIERMHPTSQRIDVSRPIKSWRTAWRAALKRAGLQIRFHDLRHTCVTKLAEGQASEQTIMAIAGHLSRRMLEHYSHIRMAAKRAALDAIADVPKEVAFEPVVHQNYNQVAKDQNVGLAKSLN